MVDCVDNDNTAAVTTGRTY